MSSTENTENLKERTARGLLWSILGNGTQQLVTMLIGIVLARVLAVEDYGLVAMLTVFSIIAGNLQESGFTSALAIKRDARHEDFNAVFWFSILVSGTIYVLLFCCAPLIARFNHAPQLTALGRVIFLGFFISSFGTAQAAWLFRHLKVREKTSSQVMASIVSGIAGLAAAFAGWGPWALVTMDLAYKLTYTSLVWYWSAWRPTWPFSKQKSSLSSSSSLSFLRPAWQMFGFGSRLLVTNILNTVNNQLLQSILGHFYQPQQVGHYSQANKWNTLGHSLLGGMIGSVAQPVLAKVEDDGNRQLRVMRKMLRFTSLMAFPAMFGMALIAPEFIPLTIGAKWSFCVPYLQVLCLGGAFIPVNSVFSNLMISRQRSDYYLYTTALFLVCQLGLVLAFAGGGDMMPLIYGITLLQPLWVIVLYVPVRRLLPVSLFAVLSDIVPFLLAAFGSIAAGYFLTKDIDADWLRLLAKIVVTASAYCFTMWVARVAVFRECLAFAWSKIQR